MIGKTETHSEAEPPTKRPKGYDGAEGAFGARAEGAMSTRAEGAMRAAPKARA